MSEASRPLLLLTVDAEENMPGWRSSATADVRNARSMLRLAEACHALGVRPTWLCTYPMAAAPESAEILRELHSRGDCEIGTHLHPWSTPPFGDVPGRPGVREQEHPYHPCDLDSGRFSDKLCELHEKVAELRGGDPPTAFRAGRFGIHGPSVAALPKLGYLVDSSITPMVDHTPDGGPDFRDAPQVPYRPSRADARRRGNVPIIEVPVSIGLSRPISEGLRRAYLRIPRRSRLRGFLSRDYLRVVDFAWLYPGRFDLELMHRVARVLVERGSPVLNVFLHSSELWPGGCPAVPSERDVEVVFSRTVELLSWCISELQAVPVTLTQSVRPLQAWLAPPLEAATATLPASTPSPGAATEASGPSLPPGAS